MGIKRSSYWFSRRTFYCPLQLATVFIILIVLHTNESQDVNRVDNFALISGTLRTFQRAGCDAEQVTLNCPRGTTISIQFAQYGRSGPSISTLCPTSITTASHDVVMRKNPYHSNQSSQNITCIWPSALQYSLLQTVVEACQKKRQCKFHPSTHTFGGDPCPGIRKYVEVAYKCRPDEFLSNVACENEKIQLECPMNHRVAVFSASYGRTEYESVHCPQPEGVAEESCLVSYATEAVMQICHGQRRCTLTADAATFGNPCRPASRLYLKVVYTCVPRTVLKETFDQKLELDEQDTTISTEESNEDYDRSTPVDQDFFHESFAHPPVTKIEVNKFNVSRISQVTSTGTPSSHRKTKDLEAKNQERFYLIVIISVSICIVIVLGLLGAHFIMARRQNNEQDKYQNNAPEHTMPREFVDDISDINDDLVLNTPLPITNSIANTIPRSSTCVPTTPTVVSTANSPIIEHPRVATNVFAVSTFGIDERHHHIHHQPPPPSGHIGYVIPPPDAYQTFQRRSDELPRGLARAPDSHYFYG